MSIATHLVRLHHARTKEVQQIFSKVPDGHFQTGLELGSGDGFQSQLLTKYIVDFTSSEFNGDDLVQSNPRTTYMEVDAEQVDAYFKSGTFDIIYSSNLLEHLPNSMSALKRMRRVMAKGGIGIHVMPSPTWKISKLTVHFPVLAVRVIRKMMGLSSKPAGPINPRDNNPKFERSARKTDFSRHLPQVHGVSSGNIAEIFAFRRLRWQAEFEESGYEIIGVRKGPYHIGGLSAEMLEFLEKCGLSTEWIYFVVDAECSHERKLALKEMFSFR